MIQQDGLQLESISRHPLTQGVLQSSPDPILHHHLLYTGLVSLHWLDRETQIEIATKSNLFPFYITSPPMKIPDVLNFSSVCNTTRTIPGKEGNQLMFATRLTLLHSFQNLLASAIILSYIGTNRWRTSLRM